MNRMNQFVGKTRNSATKPPPSLCRAQGLHASSGRRRGTWSLAIAYKPAHRGNHISGLPVTIADAHKQGWTFEPIGDAKGKPTEVIVTVKGFSSKGTASKMFHERFFIGLVVLHGADHRRGN